MLWAHAPVILFFQIKYLLNVPEIFLSDERLQDFHANDVIGCSLDLRAIALSTAASNTHSFRRRIASFVVDAPACVNRIPQDVSEIEWLDSDFSSDLRVTCLPSEKVPECFPNFFDLGLKEPPVVHPVVPHGERESNFALWMLSRTA